jgi:hypothetical protein
VGCRGTLPAVSPSLLLASFAEPQRSVQQEIPQALIAEPIEQN